MDQTFRVVPRAIQIPIPNAPNAPIDRNSFFRPGFQTLQQVHVKFGGVQQRTEKTSPQNVVRIHMLSLSLILILCKRSVCVCLTRAQRLKTLVSESIVNGLVDLDDEPIKHQE